MLAILAAAAAAAAMSWLRMYGKISFHTERLPPVSYCISQGGLQTGLLLLLVLLTHAGYATGRWYADKPVPYSRIIMHINRLWDYTTCPAAQLKIWLAHQLISAANPACKMWGKSAATAIAEDDYSEGAGSSSSSWNASSSSSSSNGGVRSPFGKYSCQLCKAGMVGRGCVHAFLSGLYQLL